MIPTNAKIAIEHILKYEGGYVNDPHDRGGETNYGVTVAVAREYGYEGEMKDMPKELAEEIAYERYLKPIKYQELASYALIIAEILADIAYNKGVSRAGKFLQACLNNIGNYGLEVDGVIGNGTLSAYREYLDRRKKQGVLNLSCGILSRNGEHYMALVQKDKTQARFINGWMARNYDLMIRLCEYDRRN